MEVIKKIFFISHYLSIYIVTFGWILSYKVIYLHVIVILSWYFNNNKCIISQLEYKLFGRTFLGKGKKYYVPLKWRYLLYINFLIGLFKYNLLSSLLNYFLY